MYVSSRYGAEYNLEQQENYMLNGQLPLTALYFPRMAAKRVSRISLRVAGLVCLGVLVAGCSSTTTRAPVVDLSKQPTTSSVAPGGTYVVRPGDTLYKVARSNGVTIADLKRWNNINDANQLNVGQVLRLASGAGTTSGGMSSSSNDGAVATSSPINDSGSKPLTSDSSSSTTPSVPVTPPAPTPVAPAPVARAADANLISWGWPASGPVTQTFTPATKGIDISGAAGAPVVSAADGKVMYSGNGVRGLGNLIIVNHDNGFITAYAHNRTLLVKTGEMVKRGSKIAEIGQSDTTSPRLHFEIRRQGTPVDPMQYLPAR
jgi:lipoprotein NlpD